MSLMTFKMDEGTYTLDPEKLTLGEFCYLEEEYGMDHFEDFEPSRPRMMLGLLTIAIKRAEPDLSDEDVQARAKSVDMMALAQGMDTPDPTEVVLEDSGQEMTPQTPGSPQ